MPSSPFKAPATPTPAHASGTSPAPHRRLGSGTTLALHLGCAMPGAILQSGGSGQLPARHPVPAASRAPRRSMSATPPVETILLVEDEPPLRHLIQRALEGQGYEVLEASNPQHAMVASDRHISEIDLLVTNVMLPDMNGFDLAYCLGGVMKVLVVTGQTEDHAGVRTGLRGTSFLRTPFRFDELLRSVRRVLHAAPTPRSNRQRPLEPHTEETGALQPLVTQMWVDRSQAQPGFLRVTST